MGESRCELHRPVDTRPSAARRGYGPAHQQLRKREARRVDAGGVLCARCGRPIIPGSDWDLGHDDRDRSRYTGPEHSACNRATSTHKFHKHAGLNPESADTPRKGGKEHE